MNVGSPPRMRGKPGILWLLRCSRRITPADAGKTSDTMWQLVRLGDHPRGCGENFGKCTKNSGRIGSPPRMRGKPYMHC